MSISEPFIRRPVATSLLMVGLFLAGLVAYRQLAVAPLPQVNYPTIVVSTNLPGASAETMASSVTTPLERQLGQVPALAQMTSLSSYGNSQITLQFSLDRNIDAAAQDVQAAINTAATLLPRTLPLPPTYSKSNPADTPILTLAVTSDSVPLTRVHDYADSILAQRISQVPGVGLVTLGGSQKPAVRVQVDPAALAGLNLTLEDIRTILGQANVHQPTGNLDGPRQDYTLVTNDQLTSAEDFRPLVIAYRNGSPIRLREVARVVDGVENAQLAGWANGHRAVILNVQRQPGANVIKVAEQVKALLPRLRSVLPQSVEVSIVGDRTETIHASVSDVQFTLVLTIALVVMVIFLFLQSLRATIIPGVTVPLSLVATFGVMYLLGYSLNNLSLMALTISTGFIVDDAIVMVENIARYIENGESPFRSALKGARQIGFTIVSLTVSLVAVLIPLLFMGGIIGRLFREFAVTLSAAIVVSALLSLSLTPMMSAHLLRSESSEPSHGRLSSISRRALTRTLTLYDQGLGWVLDHQLFVLFATLATVLLTVILAIIVPKGFFPQQDTGQILGITEASPDVSFQKMAEHQQAAATVIGSDPDVTNVASFIGNDGTNPTSNTGRLLITLRPRSHRTANSEKIIARIKPRLERLEGLSVYLQSVQDLQIESRVARTQFQYTLETADLRELAYWAPRTQASLQRLSELRDVTSDFLQEGLSLGVTIDRDTAARLGVSAQLIDETLYDAFGQRQVSTIFTQLNQYRVILEVAPEFQQDPTALQRLYVTAQAQGQVPLAAFSHFSQAPSSLAIAHQGQFPAATISFNLAPGVSLGDAVTKITQTEQQIGLPSSVQAKFQGSAQAFRDSLANEPILILAALLTVYIVLGVLYESFIHPITILSTLPSAAVGALLALLVCRTDFSVIALIGVILLIGIVKKNAIMMIDFALEAEREQGLLPRDAIRQACLLRFRPITMTTLAALLGGLPLALETGTGSELRNPLGITIVGGLLVSQILTLFTTPVIYLYMDQARVWLSQRRPWRVSSAPQRTAGSISNSTLMAAGTSPDPAQRSPK